jgi:type IV secretory pathway VirB10-like protein
MNKKIILILLILLSGCSEDSANKEEPVKNRVMVVDDSLKEVPRKKEKEPEPEKPVEIEVDMDEELESSEHERQSRQNNLSIRALELRAERKASYVSSFQKHTKMEPTKYILEDKNYDPFPKDVSTLPVDRSRTLTTDMRINAVLDDDINSQIPGVAIAIVDKPVFSPNNKFILLPVFTKIVCQYAPIEKHGQTRLPITCNRAITPNGVSITLTNAIVADQMGRTGLTGDVDNKTFEAYAGAFLMSGISALAQSGVNQNAKDYPNWRSNTQTTFSNNIGQVTAEVIRKNIDLRPVIYIKAGTRIQIRPNSDIVFKEPIPVNHKEVPHEEVDS